MARESGAEQTRAGHDDPGWEQLLAAARARARSLCRNSPIDPDDLAQEALTRLILDLDRVRDRPKWLARVIANLFVSELRRHRVRLDHQGASRGIGHGGSEAHSELDARLDLSRRAGSLSAPDRLCLQLYLAGHSHREIGARLGVPTQRIGPRIARAARRLRRSLEPS